MAGVAPLSIFAARHLPNYRPGDLPHAPFSTPERKGALGHGEEAAAGAQGATCSKGPLPDEVFDRCLRTGHVPQFDARPVPTRWRARSPIQEGVEAWLPSGIRRDRQLGTGQLLEAQNNYERQRTLLEDGWTTRVRYEARQTLETAQSRADAAQARLNIAKNRLSFTELFADTAGTVTARGAEAGEVVQAGQMIVQVAREDGRDAVFDVPAQIMMRPRPIRRSRSR